MAMMKCAIMHVTIFMKYVFVNWRYSVVVVVVIADKCDVCLNTVYNTSSCADGCQHGCPYKLAINNLTETCGIFVSAFNCTRVSYKCRVTRLIVWCLH